MVDDAIEFLKTLSAGFLAILVIFVIASGGYYVMVCPAKAKIYSEQLGRPVTKWEVLVAEDTIKDVVAGRRIRIDGGFGAKGE